MPLVAWRLAPEGRIATILFKAQEVQIALFRADNRQTGHNLKMERLVRLTLSGPGRMSGAALTEWRKNQRIQKLVFELSASLAKDYSQNKNCEVPGHVLFKQLVPIVDTRRTRSLFGPMLIRIACPLYRQLTVDNFDSDCSASETTPESALLVRKNALDFDRIVRIKNR